MKLFFKEMDSILKGMGASVVGFSRVSGKLPENLSCLPYAVTVVVRLSDFIINEIDKAPTYTYYHHYRTVNSLIDQITLRGVLLFQEKGFNAMAVPASQTVNNSDDKFSGIFPHKTAAVLAGLGWIGKSGLFIMKEFGPRVRLGTILTDMELPVEDMVYLNNCGTCTKCTDKCPALALTGNSWTEGCTRGSIVDAKACNDYMMSRFKHIGRGSVCGICMRVCPYGNK